MDNLIYTYDSGNKLTKVVNNGNDTYGFKDGTNTNDDFEYDDNGNMIIDRNKGITSITYNHLNLPTNVVMVDGNIQYIYDAAGIKIKKIVNNTAVSSLTTTEYVGNYIYENDNLQFFNTAEGYVELVTSSGVDTYGYIYQYKDHLGNIRLSYSDDNGDGTVATSEIREENNYYPFGLKHKGYNNVSTSTNPALKYRYNGKEEQNELNLNWIDYGARNYEASLGRWMNVDPLAEDYYNYSPYTYVANNPIYYIDPDGRKIIINYQDADGNDQQHTYEFGGTYDGDNQFIKDVYTSLNYILDNDADTTGIIKALSGDDIGDVSILQNTKENNPLIEDSRFQTFFYKDKKGESGIIFDPTLGAEVTRTKGFLSWITDNGFQDEEGILSPAELFLHELGHAKSSLEDPDQHKEDTDTPLQDGWDNRAEYNVIKNVENPAAKKLGHVQRNNHRGPVVKVTSPTSITPKKKK